MDFNSFKTDLGREDGGVWVDLDATARVKIARTGNSRYRDLLRAKLKPHRRAIQAETLSDDIADRLLAEVMAETVLLDWEGLTENGAPVAYSTAKARALLSDPAFKDFREMIGQMAGDMELFREQELAAAENSPKSSAGKSSGATKSTS